MTQHAIRSILFVCMGNLCRSPAGENVMRKLLADAGIEQVRCDSAGTHHYHVGEPPDSRMIAAGVQRGLPMTGTARQATRQDLDEFDLILAMDDDNYAQLLKLSTPENRAKIKKFCSYCMQHTDGFVPDPYYGNSADFEHVLNLLEDGCQQILQHITVPPSDPKDRFIKT